MNSYIQRLSLTAALFAFLLSTSFAGAQTATPDPLPAAKLSATPENGKGQNNKKGKKGGKGEGKKNKKGKGKGGNGAGAVCKADRQMYCKDVKGRRDRFACLQKNKELLSPACKDFVNTAALPAGIIPNPTPGPIPKSSDNKIEVNSANPGTKPAPAATTPAPKAAAPAPAPAAPPAAKPAAPAPEKK